MLYFLIGCCVVCAWAVLSLMGAEHSHNISVMNNHLQKQAKALKHKAHADAHGAEGESKSAAKGSAKPAAGKGKH